MKGVQNFQALTTRVSGKDNQLAIAKDMPFFAFRKCKLHIANARPHAFCTEIPRLNPNHLTFIGIWNLTKVGFFWNALCILN